MKHDMNAQQAGSTRRKRSHNECNHVDDKGGRLSRAYSRLRVHGPVAAVIVTTVFYGIKIAGEIWDMAHSGLAGIT